MDIVNFLLRDNGFWLALIFSVVTIASNYFTYRITRFRHYRRGRWDASHEYICTNNQHTFRESHQRK